MKKVGVVLCVVVLMGLSAWATDTLATKPGTRADEATAPEKDERAPVLSESDLYAE